jgi:hypothetical protein
MEEVAQANIMLWQRMWRSRRELGFDHPQLCPVLQQLRISMFL